MSDLTIGIGPYVVGEVPEPLVFTFLDADGAAIDLTGYDATFTLLVGDGDGVELEAEVTDDNAGEVTYTWVAGNISPAGLLQAEFWVDNGTNRFASPKFIARVRSAIPVAAP